MHTDPVVDAAIRKIPDFPKPGILFYDLTSLLATPPAFAHTVDRMVEMYADAGINAVAAIEARGFLLAAPFAYRPPRRSRTAQSRNSKQKCGTST